MLHEQELLLQDLKSAADRPVGALTIGAVPSVMPIAARFTGLLQAQHPGMTVVLRSMSSSDVEAGLEDLSLDLALGYTERIKSRAAKIATLDQYVERYFLLRRAPAPGRSGLALLTQPVTWLEASRQPLCMLTAEMHNRSIVDSALRQAGAVAKPAIETNSILTLGLSVLVGKVNSILPGALVGVLRGYAELEAVPLADPQLLTPIGFMYSANERASHTLKAALAMAQTSPWQEQLRLHAGLLRDDKAATKG
jgi:DNA-binding transcriptional LysR family regulator